MGILGSKFNKIAGSAPPEEAPKPAKKHPAPFSLRLSFEERAALEQAANGEPLGRYIRRKLLDEEYPPRRRTRGQPIDDHVALARVLSALGQSRITNNLNQLAKAVNTGSLPVTPDTDAAIQQACADVHEIKLELLKALGLGEGYTP